MIDSCAYDGSEVSGQLLCDLGVTVPLSRVIDLRIASAEDGPMIPKDLEFYVKFVVWDRPGVVLLLGRDWIKKYQEADGTFYTQPGSRKKGSRGILIHKWACS